MCDKTMDGKPLNLCENLKIVAACNPYRRHPKKLIKKLERAGLGYANPEKTTDVLGRIAMRQLVYRVQPLPPSLLPFVWDFGQLNASVEKLYIVQMVKRYIRQNALPDNQKLTEVISTILAQSQEYMRGVEDECCFVSLRDVDRVLKVMCWFLSLYNKKSQLFVFMGKKLSRMHQNFSQDKKLDTITRCLVLAVGVCYHASLTDRDKYRKHIANYFREPCLLPFGPEQILHEIDCCQEVILDNVNLEDNIAQNLALKENVFMMVVCIELRIPLFLVGKPGSSKSLAKVVVTDAMQGNASHHQLFKEFKQVQMVSFQCSPLSTPHGIVSTFRQCAMFQRQKNLDTFVSAVVLDEIGLAEDSPSMPLKTLHPLLEYGYEDDDIPAEEKKVAFIGISNWALDPAKMNRGIFVQRDIPDCEELENTAKGICAVTLRIPDMHQKVIKPLAAGYLEVFDLAVKSKAKREFFGLRDFYCLMKLINRFVDCSNRLPSFHQMVYAVQRNFSGLEFETDDTDRPLDIFMNKINLKLETRRRKDDPAYDLPALIKSCLTDKGSGSRHMLLLTENYNALATFQQKMLKSSIKQIVIFGSSFRRDQEYTQVCRNINRIKLCMETGYTVMLLNSESLYESLYDALNQYYVSFGGQRFVDLGLGRHRVKCPVHDDFKLIIVAEKQVVYKEFPIPLINRLEKHILTSNTLLTNEQNEIVEDVKHWALKYVSEALSISENDVTEKDIGKVFIGYHEDACSAIVLAISAEMDEVSEEKSRLVQEAKETLTWCSTPDAVVRLGISKFPDWENVQNIYWEGQAHECITQYLHYQFKEKKCMKLFAQVTTHGKLLVATHLTTLSATTGIPEERILLLESLTAFDTEQQFNSKIRKHLDAANGDSSLIIIQCESGDTYANLIACARYSVLDECEKYRKKHCQTVRKEAIEIQTHVLLIIQMPTQTNGNFRSIQCGDWHSAHIDHLLTASIAMPSIVEMQGRSIGFLVKEAMNVQIKCKQEEEAESKDAVAEEQPDVTEHKVTVDLRSILSMCIHGAMARVRDAENNGYRTTQRISLLLLLLQNSASNDAMSFLHGLSVQISRLLEDKEKNTSNPQTSDNWLAKKAASQDVIQKTGTLRRACLQVFGSVITPILSGLIAFLDTNQNLNILQMEELTWQYILWLTVLKTEDAIPLSYRDMFQDGNSKTQREFHVICTGSNGKTFQSKMPFSWVICQKIEEVLRRKPTLSDIANVAEIFAETPIGSTLECVPQEHIEEMVDFYIHDFIHMEYTFEKPKEFIVVCEFLKAKTLERAGKKSVTLTDVHLAYRDISDSLKYFREINHTWDQCSKVIKDSVVKSLQTTDITIKALYLMIEDISRKTEDEYDLAEQAGREEWLNNVHRCRHIIQQTLAHCLKEKEQTEIEKNNLLHIRSMWNRVVVLQLFLEDVCTANGEERITVEISMALWESLDEEDDMKNIETLEKLEKFLTACYETAKAEYVSKAEKCSKCETALHHDRKRLHCGHTICECCLQELLSLKKGQQTCFTCKQQLPDGWENLEKSVETDTPDRLQDYQKRCNTFFMDVVSQLCFSEGQAPSEKVVDRLMNYSLQYSNGAENVATGVDPDDAFKAFILKHLIRINEKGLKERVNTYLNELQRTSTGESLALDDKRTNSLLLVVCCIEDNLNERFSCSNVSDAVLAVEVLNVSYQLLEKGSSLVDKVYGVANARTGLGIVAKYICNLVSQKHLHENKSNDGVTVMLHSAKILCSLHWPWKYLVKCIFNIGGTDALLTACKTKDSSLNWLYNENVMKDKVTDAIDMYLCCGDLYMTIRQNLMEAVRIGNADMFLERLEQLPQMQPEYRRVLFELAVHREIILPKSIKNITRNEEVLKKIAECCSGTEEEFTTYEFEGTPFHIDGNEPDLYVSVKCLIFHWCRVLCHVNKDSLPKPVRHLKDLAENPGQFSNAFLPTMPQDDIADLRDILQMTAKESKEYTQYENPTLYICPNGHPYEVRDCGRPYYIGTCLCGATIGEKSHKLDEDNSMDTGIDRTKVGHILGTASSRNDGPIPERSLSRLYSASTRIVLHLAMCSSCCKDTKVVCSLINPPVEEEDIFRFLFEHLLKDFEDLQLVLSCNVDDVLILFHHLANNLMQIEETDFEDNINELSWLSKEGRGNWEITFAESILKPLFENSQSVLAEMKIRLQGSNALLRMVAEAEETERSMAVLENLEEESKLWNYRAPITLQSLTKEFERKALMEKQNVNHQFLRVFLSDVTILQAIRFIPNILKLHRALMNRYCYKLYRTEATSITVGKLREDRIAADETDRLIDDTIKAWDIIRKELKGHVLTTEDRRLAVPREISDVRITDTSPISILLPSTEGQSLCTYAMLDLLVRHQNAILEKYKMIYGHKGKMLSVLPRDLTVAHVMSFDPQYDIQPLILANCTLHMENVTVEYDFGGIERQLIDRFVSTKSMITLQKYLKVDLMVYRTDMKDAESLEKIEALIPQEELDGRYATQICSEIVDIPSLCQILEALDITISFLNITGGNATRYLNEYMEKTLEMNSSAVLTQKIQQICQLRHIKSLWMNISFKKSMLMVADGKTSKDVFEIVPDVFHVPLPDDQYEGCHQFLHDSKDDDLDSLLEVLFKYLVLHLTRRERENDTEFPLKSCLEEVSDQCTYPSLLETLQSKHSAKLWTTASQILLERKDGKQFN
ncbi:E3 ubiquitin-protein ligase rnf213-alpha-like [Mercenaria mercenaria]|uniref:E3 ubiquitin-protein ligase rnf213-alpha-like n=1 Tax=Mercenaria mercenaria TaxID=6596 RepID=UPI00234FA2F9|nr:E3 ubiquitin-protein ligase rnf213-alpha-like [Mercenaria mercenaria]